MTSPLKEQWSEFDWEKELRKDDERVNTYFRELPRYIDLPGEDDIIYKRIQRRKELVPHDGEWPMRNPGRDEDDDEDDDDSPEAEEERKRWDKEWLTRDGADSYILAGRIAGHLAAVFAACRQEDAANARALVDAMCSVGKIMARVTDIIELEPGELPALRIALCKRLSADTNTILGLIAQVKTGEDEESAGHLEQASEETLAVREQVLNILVKARNTPPPAFDVNSDGDGY